MAGSASPRPPEIRRLGGSTVEVSSLGAGCWAWGDEEYWRYGLDHGPREAVAAFETYLNRGIDFFDTAESYAWGKGEQILGALARKAGRKLCIATKYAPLAGRGGPAAIRKGIEGSLRRLGVPCIDLYQIHWPDRDEAPIDAAMEIFADAVEAGQVRAVGVSNFGSSEMRTAHAALARRGVPLATNQVRYSLLHRAPEVDGVLDACRELNVTLLAYSPLEQGILTGKYSGTRPPLGKRRETPWFATSNLEAARPLIEELQRIAQIRDCTPAAVALAWTLANPDVVPLAGARTGEQAEANADALELDLDEELLAALNHLSAAWRKP